MNFVHCHDRFGKFLRESMDSRKWNCARILTRTNSWPIHNPGHAGQVDMDNMEDSLTQDTQSWFIH